MGYSTPKKQLDLKEFLSTPGKKSLKRPLMFRSQKPLPEPEIAEEPAETPPADSAQDIQKP